MCKLRVCWEVKHSYLLFSPAVISPWQKNTFSEGILRYQHENRLHLVIFQIMFHQIALRMVLYIQYTLIVSYIQKALIKSGSFLHKMVLNIHWVTSEDATDLDVCCFVDASDLVDILLKMMQRTSECATEKDATDFLNCKCTLTFD